MSGLVTSLVRRTARATRINGPAEPIRAEMFGVERLEQHAISLARAHELSPARGRLRLVSRRLAENGDVLLACYRELAKAIRDEALLTPAAEWLVDNFHLVESQLHEIRESLPPSYYRQLPKLASGHLAGYPRVYAIAWAFVAHLDSRFDSEALQRFVAAYQTVEPLTIGELWALPITLRVVLVENLRRMAENVVWGRRLRRQADELADELLGVAGSTSGAVTQSRMEQVELAQPLVVQLLQRLRDHDPETTPGHGWLLQRLADEGLDPEEVVAETHHRQAATNVTVRNIVTSLRLITTFDWASFVEAVSPVDQLLSSRSNYQQMSFRTRDRYRHAIEELAKRAQEPELVIAELALRLAEGQLGDRREHEPGYFLIAEGRKTLERSIGFRPGLRLALRRFLGRHAAAVYLLAITAFTAVALALPLMSVDHMWPWGWVMAFLALVPASDVAVTFVNRLVTALVAPVELPSLALPDGPSDEFRTVLAVPALLSSTEQVHELVERLEIHYLAHPEGSFHFALISDWEDADSEVVPGDEDLLAIARQGIVDLNTKYGPAPGGDDRFLLLHRRRLFNPSEGRFMGWERKRGKLHELNRLLRGATDTNFVDPTRHIPPEVRYVIALDEDSRLPPGAATGLVATLAHPLNRARIGGEFGWVVEGYGILQPRVSAFLGAGGASFFQTVFFPPAGIDPYAAAVSDVYQDLFGEGSYAGKGIYDIDAFEAALAERVPENTLLSHDLFEGTFARAGLVSNIEVFEEFPSHYEVALDRMHRWVRGDWQLLPWILGRRGPLPPVARIKMLDNLRRSLSAPSALFTLLGSFLLPGIDVWPWTILIVVAMALPALIPLLERMIPRRTTTPGAVRLRRWWTDARRAGGRVVLQGAFLAHQALRLTDAIVLTVWRLVFTRRGLLSWMTAEQARRRATLDPIAFVSRMAPSMLVGLAITAAAALKKPEAFPAALAWSSLWVVAPVIAYAASIPRPVRVSVPPTTDEREALRLVGRRTWRFFERFVTEEDRWLPPDNYQEDVGVIAHRTSPTNIGLYLLSVLAAREFGWIGLEETARRLESTLDSMDKLERFQGHFLNWYDTLSGDPLSPRYVSTVDSGNLAGHLLAASEGCRRLASLPLGREMGAGIRDVALLIRETADRLDLTTHAEAVSPRDLDQALVDLLAPLRHPARVAGPDHSQLIEAAAKTAADIAETLAATAGSEDLRYWAQTLIRTEQSHRADLALEADPARRRELNERLRVLADRAWAMAAAMDFSFLLDPQNKLLVVGYRVSDSTPDQSHYDLLASEARLASFIGIAKGDLPPSHWFRLGRSMTPMGSEAALISWSGSIFEYLMPLLIMRSPPGSVLDTTYRTVVDRQIEYGKERNVPWGISESAYAARDFLLTYQYRAFGVPGLGFERGLSEDLVVAPYATLLAAMIEPGAAVANLARLEQFGALGSYGYYEALDFTPTRRPEDQPAVVVRAYMAHHQAMSLVAVANVVLSGFARQLFHGEPSVRASELLLHERVPRDVEVARPRAEEVAEAAHPAEEARGVVRRISTPHGPVPASHVLSNGRMSAAVTAAGSGYTRWHGLAVTRWREDSTRDDYGTYFLIKDDTGFTWSAGYQPTAVEADAYQVSFSEDRVEISRRDGTIGTALTVVISEEDDAEVRRISLSNLGATSREVEVTSYCELVLASPKTEAAHPAFANLFVQTEAVAGRDALLASRRPRSPADDTIWAAHVLTVTGEVVGGVQYETDRARFLGRGNILHRASAIDRPLSNSVGRVLDPVFSLRRRVRIPPGRTVHLDFTTLVTRDRRDALDLVDKYTDPAAFERSRTLAWTQAQVRLHHLGIDPEQAHVFQRLASSLIYFDPGLTASARRPNAEIRLDDLWRHGISGDLPIVLVRIDQAEERGLVRDLLRAQEYYRMKGLATDLVVINEKADSYAQDLGAAIDELVRERGRRAGSAPEGGIFLLSGPRLGGEERSTLQALARAVFLSHHGTVEDQLARRASSPSVIGSRRPRPPREDERAVSRSFGEFHNGLGGFVAGGSQYEVALGEGQWTPAPWINVIANERFGFIASESGSGFTWSENSRENQLTPWSNDAVSDPPGEVLYIRDDDTGEIWGPTALPIRVRTSSYVARHGPGFSEFEHRHRQIELRLHQTVPLNDSVKLSLLRIRNLSGRRRRLSVTAYVDWVVGTTRAVPAGRIVTDRDSSTGALLARNPSNLDFGHRVAFADLGTSEVAFTTDRTEFLGRHGRLDSPAALQRPQAGLSGRLGAGFDVCAALQRRIELAPHEEIEVRFLLGQGDDGAEVSRLVDRYRRIDTDELKAEISTHWDDLLGTVRVKTPERSFDLMMNHWLLYQTMACRVLGRSAFYQSGGAYGFRDQLQDVMALVVSMRSVTRTHLLRAAAHQFEEGDALHWWHEPAGKGVRTRISDDYLWLPYAVSHYVAVTGDESVLAEEVPFLRSAPLGEDEEEAYITPEVSAESASLFEHCRRALDRAVQSTGERGLPLIGTGDWNDGFNRVGREGRGESVWLGWFLAANLRRFADIAERLGEVKNARQWHHAAEELRASLEREAWDGDWYRRAFFDDGTPLGSSANPECRIDSIAQSWSVIHGGADHDRALRAMESVDQYLVRRGDGLVLLFTPPFDQWAVDPGYIKGYLPGVRENGGQYTHAAIWAVVAFAVLGDGDRAGELFSLLNPVNHASTRAGIHRYRVEPYAAAADVYSQEPHVGRGGWTWYTGSAGWMYRAGMEWILGFRLRGTSLEMDPCIPRSWPGFVIRFRYHATRYQISVENPHGANRGVTKVSLDGVDLQPGAPIDLVDDGGTHEIRLALG